MATTRIHLCRGTLERGWLLSSLLATSPSLAVTAVTGYETAPADCEVVVVDADPGDHRAHAAVLALAVREHAPRLAVVAARDDVPVRRAAAGAVVLERDVDADALRAALERLARDGAPAATRR